jgi:hypothetical protein
MLTAEQLSYIQTPEYQKRLQENVDEPGQITLTHAFLADCEDGNLTTLEYETLKKCNRPLPDDWEDKATLYERGIEQTAAYGTLTFRGLIVWSIQHGKYSWLVCNITDKSKNYIREIEECMAK